VRIVILIAFLFNLSLPAFSAPTASDSAKGGIKSSVCEMEMAEAAKRYDVPFGILYAVGLTETGRKGSLQPYALNVNGKGYFAKSANEAMKIFSNARKRGKKLIDLGCMQINYHYHGKHFSSPQAMLNPAANVAYAAKFLRQLYVKEGSWTLAVARYHAGPRNNPAQKRYVCRVMRNMISSGFGEWTHNAKNFCGHRA